MTRELFPTAASTAYDRYGRDLSRAVLDKNWVHDPSFALGTDEQVYEKVRRDAVAAQVMTFRKHLITGRDVQVEAAGDDDASQLAATIVEELLDQIAMFADSRFHLAEAVFRGSSYAFIEGERATLSVAGLPPAEWWVPRRLKDVDRRRFRLRPINRTSRDEPAEVRWFLWSVAREQWEILENPGWFVRHCYQNTEDTLGYGRGLLDALHYFQASKMRVIQEGLSAAERFGQGFIKCAVDSLGRPGSNDETNADIARAYLDAIEKHRARNAFVHAKEDDVDILGGFGEGWQLIREMLSYLDNSIRVLVLGSNLPTSATSGGSFALAEIQENSTEALVQFDRTLLAETLSRDLVGLVWRLNTGNLRSLGLAGAKPPRIVIRQEKREDPQVNAQVIGAALQAGVALRKDEVYVKLGFTQPTDEDEVFESAPAPAPGGLGLDLPGLPSLGAPAPREMRRVS